MRSRRKGWRRGEGASSPAEDEEGSFWMSYGDLFSGLMLIFALLMLTALYFYQSGVEGIREILSLRKEIAEELQKEFSAEQGRIVDVDGEGVIRFRDRLLFAQNSFEVLPEGKEQLEVFARQYVGVILDNERFRDRIVRIIVEGHTNNDGEYFYNLQLSQDRAYAVMETIIRAADERHRTLLSEKMTAVGRSFSDLQYLQDGSVDREGSRRIEMRFDLDDRTVMDDILVTVFGQ